VAAHNHFHQVRRAQVRVQCTREKKSGSCPALEGQNHLSGVSSSSDACGTCLRGFAYNLRKARVALWSIPFTTAMTCVVVHEHQASVQDDKLTDRTVRCKCLMTSPKRNEYNIRIPLSRLCRGLDAGIATKARSTLRWKVRVLLRCGTNPISCGGHNKICSEWACPG